MIVVDTSALMAVALDEPVAEACGDVMARADMIVISAGTLAESLIVAGRRNVGSAMERLIRGLGCEIAPVLEHAQTIANHASPRTKKLYDRRSDEISLDEVEKIAI
jgi:ribonuclease VapC